METDPLLLPLPSSAGKQNFLEDVSLSVNDELDGKISTISICLFVFWLIPRWQFEMARPLTTSPVERDS